MTHAQNRLVLALAIAATLVIALPVAAGAKTIKDKEQHCVVYVTDKSAEGELNMSDPTCVTSKAEAAELAGRAIYKPQMADLDGMAFGFSNFTLGIHYNGKNGTGSSITVVGTSCTGGWWNTPGWFDNRTSSSYNGCYRLKHYDKPNKTGTSANTYGAGTTDNIPTYMNNRTESVAYYSS
ncbi:MAG: hypothetical protein HKN91_03915 [Acidimicrobiia bacterium]|nr:hypothetical protein [Acidimicrobiia bacterium]